MNTTRTFINRRSFLGKSLGVVAAAPLMQTAKNLAAEAPEPKPIQFERKIKLGVIGCGGRGAWIANLFKRHGGYEMHAVADYFQAVADACGDTLGVDKSRRFSGLSGYKRVLESGIEAIALETPPYFFPEHARAAVAAGMHVYMAKPVAVDVPGCLAVEAAAKKATANRRCFLVDYQLPTDPHNREVARLIQAGEIGPVASLNSHYFAGHFPDPAFTANLESRFRYLVWCNDVALGGGYHVNACIHAIDSALWVAGQRPSSAMGVSRIGRKDPHGDSHDAFGILFEFPNGLILNHRAKHLNNQYAIFDCGCQIHGQSGNAQLSYVSKAFLSSQENGYQGEVVNLYEAGAARNIATFYENVTQGRLDNPTVPRAIDGALATILGREAARRRTKLTMSELLRENKTLEVNLAGLQA